MEIGDKVRIIGGTHHKKKEPVKWGILKSKTKTFCRIDFHDYIQSKERGDAVDEVVVKEIQVASKFLEKVPELIVEMPTKEDLQPVLNLPQEDNIDVVINDVDPIQEESNKFNADGFKILEDEEVWDSNEDTPMSFEELNKENDYHKALIVNLENQVNMLKDELSGAIANMKSDTLLSENLKLKSLLKMYL